MRRVPTLIVMPLSVMLAADLGIRTAAGQTDCTLAPAPPAGAASDWSIAVHSNCLSNLDRLGRWIGGGVSMGPRTSPEPYFASVGPASIVPGASPLRVVVLVHGWAPGYRDAVLADPALKWWSDGATSPLGGQGVWASNWAWIPTATTSPSIQVTPSGFFQLLVRNDPDAVVLGYSWTDDSATGGSYTDDTYIEVYQSEAYTNINGLRLASALEQALDPSFWTNPANELHIIGHSHGSKVATVATLALQRRGRTVDHLTVLDSPETELTLSGNGANLLGFYLNQLAIDTSPMPQPGTAFVDNYVSRFGMGYTGSATLDEIVDVMLDPSPLYSKSDPGDQHSYAAAWYAGASHAAKKYSLPPIGLDWPPAPVPNTPALNQLWSGGTTNPNQWPLTAGTPIQGTYVFSTEQLKVDDLDQMGNVTFDSSTGTLVLSAAASEFPASGGTAQSAWFEGGYYNPVDSDSYAVAFQMDWENAVDGDYVVVTVDSPEKGEFGEQEVILVLDGKSINGTLTDTPLSFCADISGTFFQVKFNVYYIPAADNTAGQVTLREFRLIVVEDAATGDGPPR